MTVPGWQVYWQAQTSSTMEDAAKLIDCGVVRDALAGAEEQTAGQGRHGRSWHSEPGAGLYVSFILQPRIDLAEVPIITLALGLAVQEAILRVSDIACDLRWPNDVMIGARKVAGILVRLHGASLIAGIGINVNHAAMPAELSAMATSLRMAAGRVFDRNELLARLAQTVRAFVELLEADGKEPILRLFAQQSSYVRGRRVAVDHESGALRGTTDGLDPSGFLWLREEHGKRTLVRAGGVRPI